MHFGGTRQKHPVPGPTLFSKPFTSLFKYHGRRWCTRNSPSALSKSNSVRLGTGEYIQQLSLILGGGGAGGGSQNKHREPEQNKSKENNELLVKYFHSYPSLRIDVHGRRCIHKHVCTRMSRSRLTPHCNGPCCLDCQLAKLVVNEIGVVVT